MMKHCFQGNEGRHGNFFVTGSSRKIRFRSDKKLKTQLLSLRSVVLLQQLLKSHDCSNTKLTFTVSLHLFVRHLLLWLLHSSLHLPPPSASQQ